MIQIDIDMPKTCADCPFHIYHSGKNYVCVATPLFYPMNLANYKDGRKDFCPLKEVPQEPFINKSCVSSEVCEHDKQKVLDKIRAEIETEYGQCDICEYFEDYDFEENDISEYRPIGNITDILQIIDKYKAEIEPQESEDKE